MQIADVSDGAERSSAKAPTARTEPKEGEIVPEDEDGVRSDRESNVLVQHPGEKLAEKQLVDDAFVEESRDFQACIHARMERIAEECPPHLKDATREMRQALIGNEKKKKVRGQFAEEDIGNGLTTTGGLRGWTCATTRDPIYKPAIDGLRALVGAKYDESTKTLSEAGMDSLNPTRKMCKPAFHPKNWTPEDFQDMSTAIYEDQQWQYDTQDIRRLSTAIRKGFILRNWITCLESKLILARRSLGNIIDVESKLEEQNVVQRQLDELQTIKASVTARDVGTDVSAFDACIAVLNEQVFRCKEAVAP